MIRYQELRADPRLFRSVTGLRIDEFDQMFENVVPIWTKNERTRLARRPRKRAIGGGPKYALELRDQLVMALCRSNLYLNTEATAFFFSVDKATVSRNCRSLRRALRALGKETEGLVDPPIRGEGKSVEQALQEYSALLPNVDANRQRVK